MSRLTRFKDLNNQALNLREVYQFEDVEPTQEKIIKIVRPIRANDKNGNIFNTTLPAYADHDTGRLCGFVKGIDPQRQHFTFRIMRIIERGVFDLSNIWQAKQFAFWNNSPLMRDSSNQLAFAKPAQLMVYDEVEDQKETIKKEKALHNLRTRIFALTSADIKKYGWLFNIDSRKNTDDVILNKLLDHAVNSPSKLNDIFSNEGKANARIIFNMGITSGVIGTRENGMFEYQGSIIGQNKELAEGYLLENAYACASIYNEARKIIGSTDSVIHLDASMEPDNTRRPVIVEAQKDAQLIAMQKELKEVKKALGIINQPTKSEVEKPPVIVEKEEQPIEGLAKALSGEKKSVSAASLGKPGKTEKPASKGEALKRQKSPEDSIPETKKIALTGNSFPEDDGGADGSLFV